MRIPEPKGLSIKIKVPKTYHTNPEISWSPPTFGKNSDEIRREINFHQIFPGL